MKTIGYIIMFVSSLLWIILGISTSNYALIFPALALILLTCMLVWLEDENEHLSDIQEHANLLLNRLEEAVKFSKDLCTVVNLFLEGVDSESSQALNEELEGSGMEISQQDGKWELYFKNVKK